MASFGVKAATLGVSVALKLHAALVSQTDDVFPTVTTTSPTVGAGIAPVTHINVVESITLTDKQQRLRPRCSAGQEESQALQVAAQHVSMLLARGTLSANAMMTEHALSAQVGYAQPVMAP